MPDPEPQQWIVVRNWHKHQHYNPAVRTPPWIKAYTAELLHSDEYQSLPLATRGVLHGLWAHYALARGVVPASVQRLSSVLGASVYRSQLERLNHTGFIEFVASKPRALDASTTRARESKNRKEKEQNRTAGSSGPALPTPEPTRAAAADTTTNTLKTIGWNAAQVRLAADDPDRARAWADHAKRNAHTNPGALAYTGYQTGEWPPPETGNVNGATRNPTKPAVEVVRQLITNQGGDLTTYSITDELRIQAKQRGETVSDEQTTELLEYATTLCPTRDNQ